MENKKIRSFICIDPTNEVIKEIARVQQLLLNITFTGKLTELENLHLTLKFLGEISIEKLEKVKAKLDEIKFNSFQAKLINAGTFSKFNFPKIVWIKIGNKQIFDLQKEIDLTLKELFKPEERFMSHLTIARVKYVSDKKKFIEYVNNLGVKKLNFLVREFKLKTSSLTPAGPVYTTIKKYKLK